MRHAEIPAGLAKARAADIARIPTRVLAKMTRADLADRLVAAGEYRRRARVPHLDGDLFSYRLGLATEVLTTDDPKRAAELVKAAGVGVTVGAGRAGSRPASSTRVTKAAPDGGYPAVDLLVDKATAARSVATALIELAKAGRLADLERDIARMRRDISSGRRELVKGPANGLAKSAGAAADVSKAARYERQASRVTEPGLRQGYLELARAEREKAGAA